MDRAVTPAATGLVQAAVLDASPNAIVGVDDSGSIIYVNAQVEATFGYGRDELLGRPIEVLLPERVAERHGQHRASFLANPVARPMGIGLDLAGRRKDGTEFPVEISLATVRNQSLQVFATIVDITARKAAENQLLQAQKLESIGRLAGGISHDFNNMLFAIRGYAELLELDMTNDGPIDRERALTSLRAVSDAADRASALTAQLLAFSRQQVVTPKVLDVNQSVRAVEPMLRRLIGEQNRLVLALDAATGRIMCDAGQLDQIVINLVINARDAMPDGGTITVETANAVFDEAYAIEHMDVDPGQYVRVSVTDTGVGMDHETRQHIFEPFFTTKDVGKGTGLGLATIYGIVSQAGGHIWLYSEPGHGSTFKLYFPRVDAGARSADVPEARPGATARTIVVVEDDPMVQGVTAALLERAGYRVLAFDDGHEALRMILSGEHNVDLVVTDVIMPDISGIEVAERVMDRLPGVGVVLLSGYTAETLDLARTVERGAVFVSKPVTSSELLRAVERATMRDPEPTA
jgi:hypothetical protein